MNRWFGRTRFPRGRAALGEQGKRAVDVLVCNVAEGLTKRTGAASSLRHGRQSRDKTIDLRGIEDRKSPTEIDILAERSCEAPLARVSER